MRIENNQAPDARQGGSRRGKDLVLRAMRVKSSEKFIETIGWSRIHDDTKSQQNVAFSYHKDFTSFRISEFRREEVGRKRDMQVFQFQTMRVPNKQATTARQVDSLLRKGFGSCPPGVLRPQV